VTGNFLEGPRKREHTIRVLVTECKRLLSITYNCWHKQIGVIFIWKNQGLIHGLNKAFISNFCVDSSCHKDAQDWICRLADNSLEAKAGSLMSFSVS